VSGTFDKMYSCLFSVVALTIYSPLSQAAGMVPETSVVLINIAEGEGTMTVTNTDSQAGCLENPGRFIQ